MARCRDSSGLSPTDQILAKALEALADLIHAVRHGREDVAHGPGHGLSGAVERLREDVDERLAEHGTDRRDKARQLRQRRARRWSQRAG